jgi:hypothetical protein
MLDHAAAEKIIRGEQVSLEEVHPRDRIHLRFGGKPYLLADSYLFLKNSLARQLMFLFRSNKSIQGRIRKLVRI